MKEVGQSLIPLEQLEGNYVVGTREVGHVH